MKRCLSIAAVSQMTLITKTTDEPAGSLVEVHGGQLIKHQPIGASNGTSITVRQLFYNTPVRYKFLKQDATERRYILDTVTQIAMAHPEVRFTLIADGTELFKDRRGRRYPIGDPSGLWPQGRRGHDPRRSNQGSGASGGLCL